MPRDILYKNLAEKVQFAIDFVADVPTGGVISTSTATAVDSSGTNATSTIVGTCTFYGTLVTVQLKATTLDRETYLVTVKATMNDSLPTVAERVVEVRLRDGDWVE